MWYWSEWCIFHRVPHAQPSPCSLLCSGVPVAEIHELTVLNHVPTLAHAVSGRLFPVTLPFSVGHLKGHGPHAFCSCSSWPPLPSCPYLLYYGLTVHSTSALALGQNFLLLWHVLFSFFYFFLIYLLLVVSLGYCFHLVLLDCTFSFLDFKDLWFYFMLMKFCYKCSDFYFYFFWAS